MQEGATLRTKLVFTWYIMHQPKHSLCTDSSPEEKLSFPEGRGGSHTGY